MNLMPDFGDHNLHIWLAGACFIFFCAMIKMMKKKVDWMEKHLEERIAEELKVKEAKNAAKRKGIYPDLPPLDEYERQEMAQLERRINDLERSLEKTTDQEKRKTPELDDFGNEMGGKLSRRKPF